MSRAPTSYHVDLLSAIPAAVYQELLALDGVTLYHTAPWHRVLARAFGWQVQAIVIRDAHGELIWLLPFVRKRRLGLGRVNVCLPLSNRVGPAYRREVDWAQAALPAEVWPVEIHEYAGLPNHQQRVQHHFTTLDLTRFSSTDELKRSFHKSSVQRHLTKAERSGIEMRKGSAAMHFDIFTALQAETRQRQGSPTYPKSFFRVMWEELRGDDAIHLHIGYLQDRPVCGVLFLHFRDTAIYGYGASLNDRSVWRTGANQLAMWSAIREAFESRFARVEFGTSPVSQPDLRIYKEHWNGESRQLPYTYGGTQQVDRTSRAAQAVSWALMRLPSPVFSAISPALMKAVV